MTHPQVFQTRGMKIGYFFVTMKPKNEKEKHLLETEMEAYQVGYIFCLKSH